MENSWSMEIAHDEMDDTCHFNEISNILNKESVQQTEIQSQEKYLKQNINEIRDNIAFQQKLLAKQHNYALDHECLKQLDYIFQRSLASDNAILNLTLEDEVNKTQASISKLSIDFEADYNENIRKYNQFRDRKLAKCSLHQNIEEGKKICLEKENKLKSLEQMIALKNQNIKKIHQENKKSEQSIIIKFAEAMHANNKEIKLRIQLKQNEEIKNQLEQKIKELQILHMATPMQNSNERSTIFSVDIGIGRLSSLASLSRGRGNNDTYLNARELHCSKQYLATAKRDCPRQELQYSRNVFKYNTLSTDMNNSFRNTSLYANLPSLKNRKSTSTVATTSKYFESSCISLSTGTKHSLSKETSSKKSENNNIKTKTASITDFKLSQPGKRIDKEFNKELVFQVEKASSNPQKKVKFSTEIKEAYSGGEQQKGPATTKLDVINIIREDIVTTSSMQSETKEPLIMSNEHIQVNNDENINDGDMNIEEYRNNYNFLPSFDPNYTYYLEENEYKIPNEPSENSEANEKSAEELYIPFKFTM